MRARWITASLVFAACVANAGAQPEWRRALERFETQLDEFLDDLTLADRPIVHGEGIFLPPTDDPADCSQNVIKWRPLAGSEPPARIVLLVHGLDEPGDIWNDLAPVIAEAGHSVARFEYPNDQPVRDSAAMLLAALRDARAAGVERVTFIGHSMGGLVTFDALTRADGYAGDISGAERLPAIERLITVGTPWAGSPWSDMRAAAEVRDQVQRWLAQESWDIRPILNYRRDGTGQAAGDLREGSELITDLQGRPTPEGLALTVLAGRIAPTHPSDLAWIEESQALREILGREAARSLVEDLSAAGGRLGDGVVPLGSALSRECPDTLVFEANHRGMIRRNPLDFATGTGPDGPPGIVAILERLSGTSTPGPETGPDSGEGGDR